MSENTVCNQNANRRVILDLPHLRKTVIPILQMTWLKISWRRGGRPVGYLLSAEEKLDSGKSRTNPLIGLMERTWSSDLDVSSSSLTALYFKNYNVSTMSADVYYWIVLSLFRNMSRTCFMILLLNWAGKKRTMIHIWGGVLHCTYLLYCPQSVFLLHLQKSCKAMINMLTVTRE